MELYLAGGPTAAGSSAFLGRGLLRIRSRRLGGRAAGGTASSRLYRFSHGDEINKHCAQYFVQSSLSPVLLFRLRLKSVADVLRGIRNKGFTQSRWDVLLGFWDAVCRHGPCGPFSSLHPWDNGNPPDLHGFFKWARAKKSTAGGLDGWAWNDVKAFYCPCYSFGVS